MDLEDLMKRRRLLFGLLTLLMLSVAGMWGWWICHPHWLQDNTLTLPNIMFSSDATTSNNTKAQFHPWRRLLQLRSMSLDSEGIAVRADRAVFDLYYDQHMHLLLAQSPNIIKLTQLSDAQLTINFDQLTTVPAWLQDVKIDHGTIVIDSSAPQRYHTIPFTELTVRAVKDESLAYQFTIPNIGMVRGEYVLQTRRLKSTFVLSDISIATLRQQLPSLALPLLAGTINGTVELSYHPQQGWQWSGLINGSQQTVALTKGSAQWQQWQLNKQPDGGSDTVLTLTDAVFTAQQERVVPELIAELGSLVHGVDKVVLHDVVLQQDSSAQDNRTTFKALTLQRYKNWYFDAKGALRGSITFSAKGYLKRNGHYVLTTLSLPRIALDQKLLKGMVAGAELKAVEDRYEARITIQSWSQQWGQLKKWLLPSKGFASFRVTVTKSTIDAVASALQSYLQQQESAVQISPFTYLHQQLNMPLQSQIAFESGHAQLSVAAQQNMTKLAAVLQQRPLLKAKLIVGFNPETDGGELAKQELNAMLVSLNPQASSNPTLRNQLIEQMYLSMQKQKLPDIGKLTPAQRAAQAEQWLLANWPKNNADLAALLEQRRATLQALINSAAFVEVKQRIAVSVSDEVPNYTTIFFY